MHLSCNQTYRNSTKIGCCQSVMQVRAPRFVPINYTAVCQLVEGQCHHPNTIIGIAVESTVVSATPGNVSPLVLLDRLNKA